MRKALVVAQFAVVLLIARNWAYVTTYRLYLDDGSSVAQARTWCSSSTSRAHELCRRSSYADPIAWRFPPRMGAYRCGDS